MQNVRQRLEEWRDAERRRDGLALGSPERQEAEEDAHNAAKVYHAEVAQVSVRYAEEEFEDRRPWSAPVRSTSRTVVGGRAAWIQGPSATFGSFGYTGGPTIATRSRSQDPTARFPMEVEVLPRW